MIIINIINNTVNAGAENDFYITHITDIHLDLTSRDDSVVLRVLAAKREKKYPFSEGVLTEAGKLHKELGGELLVTGDMLDFVTAKNLERAHKFSLETGCLFVCGNHDFRPMGGMQYDVPASREKNQALVNNAFGGNVRYFSKIVNGVNIVGLDDCYYRFEPGQLEALKNEAAKGLPIILALHAPLYTPECYDLMITEKRRYASLVCVPEEKMDIYPPERYDQQKEDAATREVYDYIAGCEQIKAVVCGHIHKNFETLLSGRLPQFVTGIDTARVLHIV